MMRRPFLFLLAPAVLLGACAPVDSSFGEAFRLDMAQQTINPDPVPHGDQMEGGGGIRAQGAVDRYDKGEVTQPISLQTTVASTGGGPR